MILYEIDAKIDNWYSSETWFRGNSVMAVVEYHSAAAEI